MPMDRIDNKYINGAIYELVGSLGIKESIHIKTIREPFCAGKVKESIETIANYLGLPIVVNLQYVPATYQRRKIGGGSTSDEFNSSALVKTDSAGRGIEGITAQVSIPSYLPLYGTPGLQGFCISVKISDNCQRHPETFMALMAHELSHVVLHSLWHKEKNNEVYTDLAAMILGFSEVINIGRKVVETQDHVFSSQTFTTTYGYLSDEQFYFALNRVRSILRDKTTSWNDLKGKTIQKLTAYKKQLYFYGKRLRELNKFIECLDKNPRRKIRKEDVPKVIEVHGPNYIGRFASVLRNNEKKLKEVELLYSDRFEHPQHYTKQKLDSLRMFCENLNALVLNFTRESDLLSNDLTILRRCFSFFDRLKVSRQSRSLG